MERESRKNKEIVDNQGVLIIIRGIPGSGKSFLAQNLKEVLGKKAIKIDPDEYRKYKKGQGDIFKTYYQSVDLIKKLQNKALKAIKSGKVVIWEQAWIGLKDVVAELNMIEKLIFPTPYILVELSINKKLAWSRIKKRELLGSQTGPDITKFREYLNLFKSVKDMALNDKILILKGDDSIEKNISQIVNKLGFLKNRKILYKNYI